MTRALIAALVVLTLSSCTGESITLRTIDDHLSRDDLQLIDLREWHEIQSDGMIEGFDVIPFFTTFVHSEVLIYPTNARFHSSHILNAAAIHAMFDADKTIVLICRSGVRSRFMHDALNHLGYDVTDLGGMQHYRGNHRVYP